MQLVLSLKKRIMKENIMEIVQVFLILLYSNAVLYLFLKKRQENKWCTSDLWRFALETVSPGGLLFVTN